MLQLRAAFERIQFKILFLNGKQNSANVTTDGIGPTPASFTHFVL